MNYFDDSLKTNNMKRIILFMGLLFLLNEFLNGQLGINDNIKNDFPLIYEAINRLATGKYPNDYSTQIYIVKEQCDACYDILYPTEYIQNLRKNMPTDEWTKIWINTFHKFSKKDLENAPCDNIEGKRQKIDCLYSYAMVDWVLVKSNIKDQIETYKKLH